ncbi:MAG: acylneuraminate cytidylyltransferase family protein [Nanoarchaeota archaeon]|nr:acylneuraminate cytidylyltransferase family protein [Nanoarchaeota archaeon]
MKYHSVGFIAFKENSQRVPRKNFRELGGMKLYERIVETARKSNLDIIFITTDSKEAIEEINSKGDKKVRILDQPPEYYGVKSTGDNMLLKSAEKIESDIYIQLFATAPFLRVETINKAIDILEKRQEYDSVFTVNKRHDWAWYDGNPITYTPGNLSRSQDAIPLIIETTGLYAIKNQPLMNLKRRVGDKPYLLEIDEIEGIDIDVELDFLMAKLIIENIENIEKLTRIKY